MLMKASTDTGNSVGIDISAKWFDAAITVRGSIKRAQFGFTKSGLNDFRSWLKKHDIDNPHLWMEATGRYYEPLAEWAVKQGWMVTVVNPRSILHFAHAKLKANKTDELDAEIILGFARCAAMDEVRLWRPKTKSQKELRDLQLVIKGLKKEIRQERSRLKCGLTSTIAKAAIKRVIASMESEVKLLHKESMALIKSDSTFQRWHKALRQVRGFGDVTIAFLLAKVDFTAFEKGRQLVKYAGLDSVRWLSGSSIRKRERISRVGHADLRSALYLPALTASRFDADSKLLAERIMSQGGSKKTAICAVMARLLRVAFALVRASEKSPTLG